MALSDRITWMPVKDFQSYEVSNSGEIRNTKTGMTLKSRLCRGYPRVTLYNQNGRMDKFVHRVVAESFYSDAYDDLEINHIDGNKTNNSVENLEFCTRSENMRHAFATGLKVPSGPDTNIKVRIVETGDVYESTWECARAINGSQANVWRCLTGERKTHKGYHIERVL